MDFRAELAKWGYNKGNSIDVETLVDEILPSLFSQRKRSYSEEDMRIAFKANYTPFSATNIGDFDKDFEKWLEQFKKK